MKVFIITIEIPNILIIKMNLSSRIKEFIQYKGVSIRSFEENAGCSIGVINRCITKNTDLTVANLMKIINKYPELNSECILTGEGNMLKDESIHHQCEISSTKENSKIGDDDSFNQKVGVPLIPLYAMAGAFTGEIEVMNNECEYYSIPGLNNADYLIQVKGNSMYPTYNSGDIVACRRINIQDAFFQWNRVYILDTDQGPLMKRIKPGSDKEHITIVSDNLDFEPFELHLSQIYHIALVLGCIKLE